MRTLGLAATAAILLSFLSAPASHAVTVRWSQSVCTTCILQVGETVDVRIYLDAPVTGIQLLGLNVLFDDGIYQYVPQPNAAVGVQSYILYGGQMTMTTALYAQQDPWQYWPAPPPGLQQVNVNWADPSFNGNQVTGLGIKIAQLRLQIVAVGDGIGEIILTTDAGGGILQVNGAIAPLEIRQIPEASTATLVAIGLLATALVGRRRRS